MNSPSVPKTGSPDRDRPLLYTIQHTLAQYQAWQIARQDIQAQIVTDFQSDDLTIDQAYAFLYHMRILVDALRLIAQQIETEVEQVEDRLTEWVCD
jgi:hypothetical protein